MNKKLLFFYIFAFLFIALPVSAHTPRIIYGQAGDIEITNPDISQAFYDELKNAPRDYFFASNKDFNLYLNILVPESANYNGRYAANVFLTNKDEDLLLYSTDLSSTAWFEFYEPFGRDYYIKGPESEIPLSAGNYKIEVYSADNTGKYVLVVGKTESFTLFDTIAIYWQLPILKLNFFNTPVWQFLFTPFGMAGIAIIFGLIILITFLGYITTSIKEKIRIKANTTILLTSAGMQVKDEILKLLHKPAYDILVGFITTATKPKEDKSYMEKELEIMREEIRFNVELIDIEGKNQSQLMKMLERKDLIYVEGGNTFYLLKHIRKSGFDKVVKKLLKRGKVYVGVSAGSIVAGPTIETAEWYGDENIVKTHDFRGMNLVPFNVFVHYMPENADLISQKLKKTKYPLRILTDEQAILVQGKNKILLGQGAENVIKKPISIFKKILKIFFFFLLAVAIAFSVAMYLNPSFSI